MSKARQELKAKLKKDMLLFGKVAMPNMFSSESPAFHGQITKRLHEKDLKQINIIAPRGHAKSSIVGGVFPLYHLLFDEGPKLVVLVSRTQDHAVKLLGTIKDALDYSEQLRYIFGYWGMNSAKKWTRSEIELKDGSMIICKGTGQQIRGIKVGNQRPTLIILDDPEDENNTKTSEAMEANLRWLLQSGVPSLDPIKGRIAVIGTPQHERCMVELLKSMKGWETMTFRPDMEKGVPLWDAVWPMDKLLNKKAELESINRASIFYREYMCQIIGDEDQLFKEEMFQYYDGYVKIDNDGEAILHITELNGKKVEETRIVNIFTGVDPASSTKQTADFSVIFNIAIDENMNRFVLPYWRKHATPLAVADAILQNFKTYNSKKTRIEVVGYQEMLREYVRQMAEEEGMYVPGLEIRENPRNAKSSRLESMQPAFAQRKVYMMTKMSEFQNELLLYPRGKHDDLLDGMYYANKGCYKPYVRDKKDSQEKKKSFFSRGADWLTA
jgi:predicted phage terminase large subunit-like protein